MSTIFNSGRVEAEVQSTRVTLRMPKRTAAILHQLVGMMGGGDTAHDDLWNALEQAFGAGKWTLADYAKNARKYKFHEPYINHAGVIVISEPGEHGEHNRPHFPCARRFGG